MKPVRAFLACLFVCWAGTACAESYYQANYHACLADADHEYAHCRHDRYSSGECHHAYRHEKNRCWRMFQEIDQTLPYYDQYGNAVRFEPVLVPQRPVYVLPGMR